MPVGSERQKLKLAIGSLPAPAFDDFLYLASEICHASIAVVTLMDTDRLWYRPVTGQIDRSVANAIASLGRGLVGAGELIVPDATEDSRFSQHRLVTAPPRIRFYAGVSLETLDGYAVGTLCVADKSPQVLSQAQRAGLQAVGRQIAIQVELVRLGADREQLFQDLDEALKNIHLLTGLLPICSSCKRIRDDKGYWDEVDHYIQTHSHATFTHAVCPKCFQRLYPDYVPPAQ